MGDRKICLAEPSAIARPMPRPAPVTIATFLIARALLSGIASLKTVAARMANRKLEAVTKPTQ